MADPSENVTPLHAQQRVTGNGGGDGHDLHGRVSALEASLKHLATKEDIQKLRVWVLGGVIGAGVIALGIAAIFVRWSLPTS